MTIENLIKRWIIHEMEGEEDAYERLQEALEDNDVALLIWDNFEAYHYTELVDAVTTQIKAILKKHPKK